MLYTPPQDWHTASLSWQPAAPGSTNHYDLSLLPTWPRRINAAPIDTSLKPQYHQLPVAERMSGALLGHNSSRHNDIDGQHNQKPASYPHGLLLTQPLTRFNTQAVSPAALVINPSATSSYSPPVQAPLKLHQPRPSRRIPIVNLDRLASACEGSPINAHPKDFTWSENTLSPLDLDCHSSLPSQCAPVQQSIPSTSNQLQALSSHRQFGTNQETEKVILCGCGCMESYTFRG
jgi:hypothetical protein